MTSQFLPVYRNNAEAELDELHEASGAQSDYPELLRRSQLHRIGAIAELLMSADTASFREGLQASAASFADGLARVPPTSVIVSRAAPLVDALAAQRADSAHAIARHLTRKVWQKDYEYQEDYFYFQCLAALALADQQSTEQCFAEWTDECADEDAGRFVLTQAWLGGDAVGYADALDLLLRERDEYCDAMRAAGGVPEEILDTEGRVFVEGMMWVVLGRQRGFPTESDYLFVPSVVFEEGALHASQAGL